MIIAIHLLGRFRVLVDGVLIEDARWGRRKSKTLVKLLALQPLRHGFRQMHREELIALLWPDLEPEPAFNNFNKALHAARRSLEPSLTAGRASRFLQTRDQLVQLAGEVSVDVSAFELSAEDAIRTADRAKLESALRLYEGDLLPEDLYEDWTAVQREHLRSIKGQALLKLAEVCEASANLPAAVEAYRQLIVSDPCNEAAHRGVMRLQAASGQRHLALEQFRICKEALQRDLEAEPEAATIQLYEWLLGGARSEGSPVSSGLAPGGTDSPAVSAVPAAAIQTPQIRAQQDPKSLSRRWLVAAAVVLLCAGALAAYRSLANSKPLGIARPIQFVAIMPLTAGDDSPELEYVADGITESIINELSQLRQVRVMARSTVYSYRAKGMEPMAAAIEMKVQAILLSTITKHRDNFHVSAELVEVPQGTRIWGNQYELSRKDLISIQDRIATGIATGLGVSLSRDDRTRLSPSHPDDPETYRLYLQARFFWNQRSKEGYLKSIELFQAAIARDPSYARAYAGLSDSYSFLGRDEAPTPEYVPKAKAAAEKALVIDDNLAEAHASLAMMSNVYDWNFAAAEHGFRRALDLDPGYPTTRLFYGVFLASQGRLQEAQTQLDQAAELDPLSPIIALCRGYPASFEGRTESAIQAAQQALAISPGFAAALEDLMTYFERQGRQQEAMQESILLLHARGQHELAEAVEAGYRKSGYQAAVRLWFESEEQRAAKIYVSPLRIAILAMRAGQMDKAFAWLDRAVEAHNAGLVYLPIDPKYARLWSDPRFDAVIKRMGLKPRKK